MCHGKVRILWLTQVLEMINWHLLINEDQINEEKRARNEHSCEFVIVEEADLPEEVKTQSRQQEISL